MVNLKTQWDYSSNFFIKISPRVSAMPLTSKTIILLHNETFAWNRVNSKENGKFRSVANF